MSKNKLFTLFIMLLLTFSLFSSAVHDAVNSGDLELLKGIITENGSMLETKNDLGLSPLNLAAVNGNMDVFNYLVKAGADIKTTDREGSNLLHNATANNHLKLVKYLVEELKFDVNSTDNLQMTPLMFASEKGNYELLNYLIDKGADINAATPNKTNVLMLSAYGGNLDVVKRLLDLGLDINERNDYGAAVITYAAYRGHLDIVEYLIEQGADYHIFSHSGESPLSWAIVARRFEVADFLLEKGMDINMVNERGQTPIFAAYKSFPESVEYMINKGANVTIADSTGLTPIHQASRLGRPETVQLLIEAGADVNAVTTRNETPLHYAALREDTEVMKLLLDAKADIDCNQCETDACTWFEGSPIILAAKEGNYNICELLVDRGVDVNQADDRYGRTALHWSSIKGFGDVASVMIAGGADCSIKDKDGYTAIDYASKYGNYNLVNWFQCFDKKNKINYEDNNDLIKSGEAIVSYTGHSGWIIQTEKNVLVFDYWQEGREPEYPGLRNGYFNPEEYADKKVMVFVSHSHGDHYDERIWEWNEVIPNLNIIAGFQPETEANYIYLPGRTDTTIADVNITTINSNDTGVGFLVQVDGLSILHMGDHANRTRDFSGNYLAEIDYIKTKTSSIDLGFLPISGCNFGDQVAVKMGVHRTFEELDINYFMPMHSINAEHRYQRFIDETKEDGYNMNMFAADAKGDHFKYAKILR